MLTRGFFSLLKGFSRTSHCHIYFPYITFFFSQHHGVKASIFIVYELFHQNVLLDISHTFHTSFTNLTCTYTQLSRFKFFFSILSLFIYFPTNKLSKHSDLSIMNSLSFSFSLSFSLDWRGHGGAWA